MKGRFAIYVVAAALLAACQSKPAPETPKPAPVATVDASSRASIAEKQEPDIKGLKLGATKADVLALFPEATCEEKNGAIGCTAYHVSYGSSESGVLLAIIADGAARYISVSLLEKDKFDYMITGMVAKFGQPAEPSSPARIAHVDAVGWGNDDWLLLADRKPKDLHYPQVILVDRRWSEGKAESNAAEAAKSL